MASTVSSHLVLVAEAESRVWRAWTRALGDAGITTLGKLYCGAMINKSELLLRTISSASEYNGRMGISTKIYSCQEEGDL